MLRFATSTMVIVLGPWQTLWPASLRSSQSETHCLLWWMVKGTGHHTDNQTTINYDDSNHLPKPLWSLAPKPCTLPTDLNEAEQLASCGHASSDLFWILSLAPGFNPTDTSKPWDLRLASRAETHRPASLCSKMLSKKCLLLKLSMVASSLVQVAWSKYGKE